MLCWLGPLNSHFLCCNIVPFRARGPNPTDVLGSNTSAHAIQKQSLPPPNPFIFHPYLSQGIYHTLFCITIIYRYVGSQLSGHFFKTRIFFCFIFTSFAGFSGTRITVDILWQNRCCEEFSVSEPWIQTLTLLPASCMTL